MAEYVTREGRGGAAGIGVPIASCIVFSRPVSSTTLDTKSAFTSSKLAYGLCAFAARPIHREVVGFVAFAHRSKASAKELSPSGLAAKADFARRRALGEPGASRYIPEAPWNDEVAAAQRLEQVVLQCG